VAERLVTSRRTEQPYGDRLQAGEELARALAGYAGRSDVTVLALPRGGVPVAFEVARSLHAPLDVYLVRKLGAPGEEELAIGAVASGGVRVLNTDIVRQLGVPEEWIASVSRKETSELDRRQRLYRQGRGALDVGGRIAILVDDGLATGATMKAAIASLRQLQPAEIVVAVPVAARPTAREIAALADRLVCPLQPETFRAVGEWYEEFPQTTDEEVQDLIDRANA
jgi:predicted phosphoribosyltransferase